jgi:hypothetical protein
VRFFILCLLALLVAACGSADVTDQNFANLADATQKGGLREGGWLPRFLPPSASEIKLRSNIDTNEVWVAFAWDGADRGDLANQCRSAPASSGAFPGRSPSWWPADLVASGPNDNVPSTTEFLRCTDGGFVALRPTEKRGYYWHSGRSA